MGSSRKHKDKDRESKRKHRRSRSRSKERDYESRDKDRERDHDRHVSSKHRRRHRSPSDDENIDYNEKRNERSAKRSKKIPEEIKDESVIHSSKSNNSGEISLSIEETNKIRLKLGLKPLEDSKASKPVDSDIKPSADNEEIFIKTENMAAKKKTETLREKLEAQREKRKIQNKMKNVKGLADSDSEDDALSWVNKSRKVAQEKKKAEERAKLLEEMDEEFGVGNLVDEEFTRTKANLYSSKHLSGMNIGHSSSSFNEGRAVILTLKDKDVLAEEEDVLQNVNLLDDEHAVKNISNKKKLAGYQPYDDPEYNEYGELKKKELLEKYDEEIEGPKKDSFKLGSGGQLDLKKEAQLKSIKAKLQQKNFESLTLPEPVIAAEFYTSAEMVQFKKPKKKMRKVRKKVLRADDLEPLPESSNDHGSRIPKNQVNDEFKKFKENWETGVSTAVGDDMEVVVQPTLTAKDLVSMQEEYNFNDVVIEEDQAEADLQLALNKARKLKQMSAVKTGIEKVAQDVRQAEIKKIAKTANVEGASIIMNETAEFCRALGDIPTYGQSGNREDEDDMMDIEDDQEEKLDDDDTEIPRGAWNEVEIDDRPVNIEQQDEGPILEEEPVVGLGIAGALQLATQKGYLDKEIKKAALSAKQAHLQAANYTIEDKNYDDEKVGNSRRSDRFISGPINEFKDKDSYKPDIKLDYIDDSGRILSQKEAFRYLSHKFHGKGPGKMKTEKRVKKQEEDVLLRQMSSTDTPLKTLSMLQDKQKETQSPFVILSGGSKALQSNSLSKTK